MKALEAKVITLLCSGTRGDVQPYIALAQALTKRGLAARIAANKDFEGFVRGYGIDYFPVDVDHASVGVDPEMVRQAQKADNVFKMFASFRKLREYGVFMVEKYADACLGSEAIVWHPGLSIGHFMARRLGIPSIVASPFPIHATAERPSVVLYGKVPSFGVVNRLSYRVLQGMLWMASESSLKPFLKAKEGALPRGFGNPLESGADEANPAVISCSEHVFSRPADWRPSVHQSGYWFVEEAAEYRPSPELAAFLAAGDKPVYVGFGSMFDREESQKVAREVIAGLALAGRRGVISGMGRLEGLPAGMIAIDGAPHSWLFPRMAAVVHHGGAGTSAAGFRSGTPSVIVPFALDQHAWALRSFELGVGSRPLPAKKLSAPRLAEAIGSALRPETVKRAAALGRKIAEEHGARDCAKVIAEALVVKTGRA